MKKKLKLSFDELPNELETITVDNEMKTLTGGYSSDDVMSYLTFKGFNFHDNGDGTFIAYGDEYTGSSDEVFGSDWNDWLTGQYGGATTDFLNGSDWNSWISFSSGTGSSGSDTEYWIWDQNKSEWVWMGCNAANYNAPHYSSDLQNVVVSNHANTIETNTGYNFIQDEIVMSHNDAYSSISSYCGGNGWGSLPVGAAISVVNSIVGLGYGVLELADASNLSSIQDAIATSQENVVIKSTVTFATNGYVISISWESPSGISYGSYNHTYMVSNIRDY